MSITLAAGGTRQLNVSLETIAVIIWGTVYDATTGSPIAGVAITVNGYRGVPTDIGGYFDFEVPSIGTVEIRFAKDGYESSTITRTLSLGRNHIGDIPLTPIVVPETGTLFGKVTDSTTGAGIPTPLISLDTIADYGDYYGNYRIHDIPFGTYTVTFSKEGYEPQTREVSLTTGEPVELNVALTAAEELIRLSDLSIIPSAPIEGDTVSIRCRATNVSPVGATLSRHVDLLIDGIVAASWDLTLAWAETVWLEHTLTATGIGEHLVEFDGLVGTFEVLAAPPVNLFIPEPWKLIFDGKSLYESLHHSDPDVDWQNRALETADFSVSLFDLQVTAEDYEFLPGVIAPHKALWQFEGNWELLSGKLESLGPTLRVIREDLYNSAEMGLPYPSHRVGYGYEDYIAKFIEDCCYGRGYLPEWDWDKWLMSKGQLYKFYWESTDPPQVAIDELARDKARGINSGVLSFTHESIFGYWRYGWRYPSPGTYVVILEINVALKIPEGVRIYPLYVWRVGTISF